jgi:hypothetical protein
VSTREKWAEYRRIRDIIYSACWDCERPCAACCEWSRLKAFGRPTGGHWLDDACSETYATVMEMRRRGTMILIGSPAKSGTLTE